MVGAVAVLALMALILVRAQVIGDSWLALLGGREVARGGLPHHDTLFIWTHGREWIDQQWLAQLGYYGLYVVGGVRLLVAANSALFVSAGLLTFVFARRRGASPRAIFLVSPVVALIAPWAMQARAQTVAEVLFAATFGLLTVDRPLGWRRTSAVLALLVLWANVHGTVVLGAGLAALGGLFSAAQRRPGTRGPAFALLVLSPVCVFASPYGLQLGGYYREMLTSPYLPRFIAEWKASTPSVLTATFYFVLLGGIWLLGRYGKRVPLYDKIALALLAVSALFALRSIIWFGLAAAIVLTPLVDDLLGATKTLTGQLASWIGVAAAPVTVVVAALTLAAPETSILQYWPRSAASRVADIATRRPDAQVFADETYADWLVFTEPRLQGRIAYDARFELLQGREFEALSNFRHRTGIDWARVADGYGIFVYSPSANGCPVAGCVEVYRHREVTVAVRRSKN